MCAPGLCGEKMTEKDFFERLRQSNHPVVVDFWAPWCGPCKMIDPQLKKLDKEYEGQVEVWKINADEQPQLLRQLHIYGIPTLVSFKDGREVARQTGVAPYPVLAGLFDQRILAYNAADAERKVGGAVLAGRTIVEIKRSR